MVAPLVRLHFIKTLLQNPNLLVQVFLNFIGTLFRRLLRGCGPWPQLFGLCAKNLFQPSRAILVICALPLLTVLRDVGIPTAEGNGKLPDDAPDLLRLHLRQPSVLRVSLELSQGRVVRIGHRIPAGEVRLGVGNPLALLFEIGVGSLALHVFCARRAIPPCRRVRPTGIEHNVIRRRQEEPRSRAELLHQ